MPQSEPFLLRFPAAAGALALLRRFGRYLASGNLLTLVLLMGCSLVIGASVLRAFVFKRYMGDEIIEQDRQRQQLLGQAVADTIAHINTERLQALAVLRPDRPVDWTKPAVRQAWRTGCQHLQEVFPRGCLLLDAQGAVLLAEPAAVQRFTFRWRPPGAGTGVGRIGAEGVLASWLPLGAGAVSADHASTTRVPPAALLGLGPFDRLPLPPSSLQKARDGLLAWTLVLPGEGAALDLGQPGRGLRALGASADEVARVRLTPMPVSTEDAALAPGWLVIHAPVPGTSWYLAVASARADVLLPITHAFRTLLILLPFNLVLFLVPGLLALRFTRRRLSRTADIADRMTRGEMAITALPANDDHEFNLLVRAFNRLIGFLAARTRELSIQKELAEEAMRVKARFLAAAGHDLSQPLHALSLQLARVEATPLTEQSRQALNDARLCAGHLQALFTALLQDARADGGSVQIRPEPVSLLELCELIRAELLPQAAQKGLSLRLRPGRHVVHCDRAVLERIVRNFVSNAIRHTTRGGILLGCRRRGPDLLVSVYDTGKGIAPEFQDRVFDEFFQIPDAGGAAGGGWGLGLAIVRGLATAMQADVTLTSVSGRGSCFAIRLPCSGPVPAHDTQPTGDSPLPDTRRLSDVGPESGARGLSDVGPESGARRLSDIGPDAKPWSGNRPEGVPDAGVAVLLRDASRTVPLVAREQLVALGYRVVVATSGEQARLLGVLTNEVPALVTGDGSLRGGESALEAVIGLRDEFNAPIPALLCGAAAFDVAAAEAAGVMVADIDRPLSLADLRSCLATLQARCPG